MNKQILEIKKIPNPALRSKCQHVEHIGEKEIELFENMIFTMHSFQGIGLAASQLGISRRIIVVDVGEGPIKLANPEIVSVNGKDKMVEGCLSVPDVNVEIVRPYEVVVKGLSEKGKIVEVKAEGLLARVLLHEIDHINGKLILDYQSFWQKLKNRMQRRQSRPF